MIANLLNTVIGIWLTYAAVLDPAWANANDWKLPVTGLAVIVFALWARATSTRKWQANVNVALAVVLLILAALHWRGDAPSLLMFWGVFWIGLLVAILALWAALYRPNDGARST